MKRYRVKEIWQTIQGEGYLAGTACAFVRLVGCNLWSGYEKDRQRDHDRNGNGCAMWCDTQFTKEGSRSMTADEIAREASATAGPSRRVTVSGGEPLLQLDTELVRALHAEGLHVAVETNGTVPLPQAWHAGPGGDAPDWITVSPKLPDAAVRVEWCSEAKLVVPDYLPTNFPSLASRVLPLATGRRPLYVQPEDGPRLTEAIALALALVTEDPAWTISTQTHKALNLP